jgi:hypothetical protein
VECGAPIENHAAKEQKGRLLEQGTTESGGFIDCYGPHKIRECSHGAIDPAGHR